MRMGRQLTARRALGVTPDPVTASLVDPMTAIIPEMSITADFGGQPLEVAFSSTVVGNTTSMRVIVALYDNGVEVPGTRRRVAFDASARTLIVGFTNVQYTPPVGERTLDVRWAVTAGQVTALGVERQLTVAAANS